MSSTSAPPRPPATRRLGVELLADFVVAADTADLPDDAAALLRRNVLDSIACAVAALDGETVRIVREQIDAVGGRPRASLIGGGRSSIDQAALFNSVAVRYVDLLDTYLTPGGLCHPADNFGALLAVAESVSASGAEFLLALAVAYEVQCRFSSSVPVMAHGLNHALQLAISVAAGTAKLLRLTPERTANAIAIAASDNVSVAAIHSEPVSNWKGISPGITAQRAVYASELARRGVTGPLGILDGPNGLEQLFGQAIDLRLQDRTLGAVRDTYLKKYCALIHGQAPIETILTIARRHGVRDSDVESVRVEVFQTAYDIAGGGSFGPKDAPLTKEQADYNLKYLLAAALIDGQVGPEQLEAGRIRSADVQELLRRIEVRPNEALSARYPGATPVRISMRLRDGRELFREQDDFEGAPGRPLTWDQVAAKFRRLADGHADHCVQTEIIDRVAHLEELPVSALTSRLATLTTGERS